MLFENSYTMKMGDVRLPKLDFFIVNELSLVATVMNDRDGIYPKHHFLRKMLDPLIGNSVFSAIGKDWDEQRKMVHPAFAAAGLQRIFPVMQQAVDDLVEHLRGLDHDKPAMVEPLMTHVAADIIYRTIFSQELDKGGSRRIYDAFAAYQRLVQPGSVLMLYGLPLFGYYRKARAAAGRIHAEFRPIVEKRFHAYHEVGDAGPPDILRSLLEARHPETGEPFDLQQIINQVSTVFLAGHETAASSMAWGLYLLSECPDLQDAIRGEIGEEAMSFETLKTANTLRDTFRETLRLYPPLSFFLREITQPTTMRKKEMKPGSIVAVSPWLIQRNANNFPCPHAFQPERFADPEQAEACRHAYLPFGKGPRMCIGAGFANQEAMLVLGTILQNFTLSYPEGPKPEPINRVTLRSAKGIPIIFTPRQKSDATPAEG